VRGRGRFITLEGGEGAGKSTHARRLADWLRSEGLEVLVTREPGGSPHAESLRSFLLQGRFRECGPEAEALAFALARADHVAATIRPALAKGAWVISDRFIDSTRAYQGTAGADLKLLDLLDKIAVGSDRPDLTLILDVPPEVGLRRMLGRKSTPDRFEAEPLPVQEARRQTYRSIAAKEPERCVIINAAAGEDDVAGEIQAAVAERLKPRQLTGS
jgi:dTMP kinase